MRFTEFQFIETSYQEEHARAGTAYELATAKIDKLRATARETTERNWPLDRVNVCVNGEAFYLGVVRGQPWPTSSDLLAAAALRHVHERWMAGELDELPPDRMPFVEILAWCEARGLRGLQREGFR